MKVNLYDVPRGTWVRDEKDRLLRFIKIDGMVGKCQNYRHRTVNLRANARVVLLTEAEVAKL